MIRGLCLRGLRLVEIRQDGLNKGGGLRYCLLVSRTVSCLMCFVLCSASMLCHSLYLSLLPFCLNSQWIEDYYVQHRNI